MKTIKKIAITISAVTAVLCIGVMALFAYSFHDLEVGGTGVQSESDCPPCEGIAYDSDGNRVDGIKYDRHGNIHPHWGRTDAQD